jgi:hypothetical protein
LSRLRDTLSAIRHFLSTDVESDAVRAVFPAFGRILTWFCRDFAPQEPFETLSEWSFFRSSQNVDEHLGDSRLLERLCPLGDVEFADRISSTSVNGLSSMDHNFSGSHRRMPLAVALSRQGALIE